MSAFWLSASEDDLPAGEDWLAPGERERAGQLRFTKRRIDYLLGRFAAKSAVTLALGWGRSTASLRRIEVRNRDRGPDRGAPLLRVDGEPGAFEVSITDRAGSGVCLLTPAGFRAGCDLELVEPRSDAFVADYLTPGEQFLVGTSRDARQRHARANLIWSAKESVLKLLRTGLRRDPRSVEVVISEDGSPEPWHPLEARTAEGGVFTGWWRAFEPFLLTIAYEMPDRSPVALVEPPSLEGAHPTHQWLEAPRVGTSP